MLDINVAIVIFVIFVAYVLGTLTGIYIKGKFKRKNGDELRKAYLVGMITASCIEEMKREEKVRSAFSNMAVIS